MTRAAHQPGLLWLVGNLQKVLRGRVSLHLIVGGAFIALSASLLWPITGGDYPPGVDTPTFLHLSWIAEMAVSGQLADPLIDPFWYGGFFYLVYPPLGYGLVGVISAVTSANFVDVYTILLIISYGALGYSTWFMAREFGLRWWSACCAGLFTTLAYPSLNAVFLWGWFTSVMALPFAILSFALLERLEVLIQFKEKVVEVNQCSSFELHFGLIIPLIRPFYNLLLT